MHAYVGRYNQDVGTRPIPGGGFRYIRIRTQGADVFFETTNDPTAPNWDLFMRADGGQSWLADVDRLSLGIFNGNQGGMVTTPAQFDNLNRCPR
jgi:hypothetical protein